MLHLLDFCELLFKGAQNHGWLTDNVWPEWRLDQPTTLLASHVGGSHRLLCHGQTAKSSPANFRFCLFVKIESCSLTENYRRISSLFFQVLTSQKIRFDQANIFLAGYRVGPLSWALTEVIQIPVFLNTYGAWGLKAYFTLWEVTLS